MEDVNIWLNCPICKARNFVTVLMVGSNKLSCSECGAVMLDYEPVRGFVYVISNAAMPGLLKVGFTVRSVDERIAELNSGTAVPSPFIVEGVFPSTDPESHELQIHRELAATRLQPQREFFKITAAEALRIVANVCGVSAKYLRESTPVIRPRTPKEDTTLQRANRLAAWREPNVGQ